MQNRKSLWAMAFAVFLCVLVWTVQLPVYAADTVHVITITGEIDGGQASTGAARHTGRRKSSKIRLSVSASTRRGAASTVRCASGILLQHSQVPTIALVTSRAWSAGALIAIVLPPYRHGTG
jgi:membrane-bound serine protease (ClpP class)